MAQYARPVSDVNIGGWTATPLYQKIDEASYSDADYIQRNAIAYCEVGLSPLTDPVTSDGHYVRYRLGRSRIDRALTIVVRLYQGSTEIASWTHTDPALAFVGFEQALTAGEANAITDYGGLRLWFDITALQNTQVYGRVSWAEVEVPDYVPGAYYHGLSVQGVGELALCDAGIHPLRIRKGGTTYGVELVATGDPNASKIRIQTSSGTKAIRKYT